MKREVISDFLKRLGWVLIAVNGIYLLIYYAIKFYGWILNV